MMRCRWGIPATPKAATALVLTATAALAGIWIFIVANSTVSSGVDRRLADSERCGASAELMAPRANDYRLAQELLPSTEPRRQRESCRLRRRYRSAFGGVGFLDEFHQRGNERCKSVRGHHQPADEGGVN